MIWRLAFDYISRRGQKLADRAKIRRKRQDSQTEDFFCCLATDLLRVLTFDPLTADRHQNNPLAARSTMMARRRCRRHERRNSSPLQRRMMAPSLLAPPGRFVLPFVLSRALRRFEHSSSSSLRARPRVDPFELVCALFPFGAHRAGDRPTS